MTRTEWLILALNAAEGGALTPVQLQKSLFLVGKLLGAEKDAGFYEFTPYDYGPFDRSVYDDAEELEASGLAKIDCRPGRRWREYSITLLGMEQAEKIEIDPDVRAKIKKIVMWTRERTFAELVTAIYQNFPEMKVNSVFTG